MHANRSPEKYLHTGYLMKDIRGRTTASLKIMAVAQVVKFCIGLASVIIMTRLLTAEDFGLIAMVVGVTTLLRIFKDLGLSTATIQREEVTQAQVSNLFWTNALISLLSSLVVAASAPAVAWFYREPRLVPITLALSVTFFLGGASVQHRAVLSRQMRYKRIALIDIGSLLFGLLVGVSLALGIGNYWALVGLQVSTAAFDVMMTWGLSRWRPQWPRRRSGTRAMLHFGASLTISNLLRRLAQGGDALLLGRFYGADILGFYSRAHVLMNRPVEQFLAPFETVLVPALSRMQGEPGRYRHTFIKIYGVIALLCFALAGLLLGVAQPLILAVLGERWAPVIPIFQWFTIMAIALPMGNAGMWLLTTHARSREILITGLLFSLLAILSFVVGLPFGAEGVAGAFALSTLLVRLPLQYHICGKSGPVSSADQWGVFLRHLPIWITAYAAARLACSATSPLPHMAQLGLSALASFVATLSVVWIVPPLRSELLAIVGAVGSRTVSVGVAEPVG